MQSVRDVFADLFFNTETKKFQAQWENTETTEIFGWKNCRLSFGEIGGIERDRDLGFRIEGMNGPDHVLPSGGKLGRWIAPVQKEVWDSSTPFSPVLLMNSRDEGFLSKSPSLLKRYILYPMASIVEPQYTIASDATACFNSMAKVDDFFSHVFFENPVEISRTKFRAYLNHPGSFENANWVPRNSSLHSECLWFGDPGPCFNSFQADFSILAHEAGHSIVDSASRLNYEGQSGALNESIADVFSIMMQHYYADVDADGPDTKWFIGEGIRKKAMGGNAMRSMKDPESAFRRHRGYENISVGHMRNFHYLALGDSYRLENDYGYVHANSGIPNRAFVLAAEGIGGKTYDKVGRIWHRALFTTSPQDTFSNFARRTMKATDELGYGNGVYNKVGQAWMAVGVDIRHRDRSTSNNQEGCTIL